MKFHQKLLTSAFTILTLVSLSAFKPELIKASDCGGPYPPMPDKVWAKSGPGPGQVTLSWNEVPFANRYAVAYGTSSGQYMYGADNIGGVEARSYTVSLLNPGQKYYFRLAAARDCTSSPFSAEISQTAGYGGAVITNTGGPVSQAKTPAVPASSILKAWSGPGVGQVTLSWQTIDADNFHVVYGERMGEYQYGALNIGKTNKYTVGHLVPGRNYYFAIVPQKGDQALYTTEAVAARAYMKPVEIVQTPPDNIIEITPSAPEATIQLEPTAAPEPQVMTDEYWDGTGNPQVEGAYDQRVGAPVVEEVESPVFEVTEAPENLNYGFGD